MIIITKHQRETLLSLLKVSNSLKFTASSVIAMNQTKTAYLYTDSFGVPPCWIHDASLLLKSCVTLGDCVIEPSENGLTVKSIESRIFIPFSDDRLCKITLPDAAPLARVSDRKFKLSSIQLQRIQKLATALSVDTLCFNFSSSGLTIGSHELRPDDRNVSNNFNTEISTEFYEPYTAVVQKDLIFLLDKCDYSCDLNDKSVRFVVAGRTYFLARKQ